MADFWRLNAKLTDEEGTMEVLANMDLVLYVTTVSSADPDQPDQCRLHLVDGGNILCDGDIDRIEALLKGWSLEDKIKIEDKPVYCPHCETTSRMVGVDIYRRPGYGDEVAVGKCTACGGWMMSFLDDKDDSPEPPDETMPDDADEFDHQPEDSPEPPDEFDPRWEPEPDDAPEVLDTDQLHAALHNFRQDWPSAQAAIEQHRQTCPVCRLEPLGRRTPGNSAGGNPEPEPEPSPALLPWATGMLDDLTGIAKEMLQGYTADYEDSLCLDEYLNAFRLATLTVLTNFYSEAVERFQPSATDNAPEPDEFADISREYLDTKPTVTARICFADGRAPTPEDWQAADQLAQAAIDYLAQDNPEPAPPKDVAQARCPVCRPALRWFEVQESFLLNIGGKGVTHIKGLCLHCGAIAHVQPFLAPHEPMPEGYRYLPALLAATPEDTGE